MELLGTNRISSLRHPDCQARSVLVAVVQVGDVRVIVGQRRVVMRV